jgi:uncharacterized protein
MLHSLCYVKDTGTALGRGVFAARRIGAGELIEDAPVVLLECGWRELPREIQHIVFGWSELTGEHTSDAPMPVPLFALALGIGSLFNHANPANVSYRADADRGHLQFHAVIDIEADTQLTINYDGLRGSATSVESHWFERNGVMALDVAPELAPDNNTPPADS